MVKPSEFLQCNKTSVKGKHVTEETAEKRVNEALEAVKEKQRIEHKEYQKKQRTKNRKRLGVNADDSKLINSLSFSDLEGFKRGVKITETRVITQTNKTNRYESSLLRQVLQLTGFRSIREFMVETAEDLICNHLEGNTITKFCDRLSLHIPKDLKIIAPLETLDDEKKIVQAVLSKVSFVELDGELLKINRDIRLSELIEEYEDLHKECIDQYQLMIEVEED